MSAKHVQLGKGVGQLPRKIGTFFTAYGFTGADDDEKACFQFGAAGVVRRAQNALGTVSLHCAADLFGNRQSQTVDGLMFGVRAAQSACRQILEDVDGAVFSHESFAVPIGFTIQMIFFDGNVFHRSPE